MTLDQVSRPPKNRKAQSKDANENVNGWGGRIRTFDRLIQSSTSTSVGNRQAQRSNGAVGQAASESTDMTTDTTPGDRS